MTMFKSGDSSKDISIFEGSGVKRVENDDRGGPRGLHRHFFYVNPFLGLYQWSATQPQLSKLCLCLSLFSHHRSPFLKSLNRFPAILASRPILSTFINQTHSFIFLVLFLCCKTLPPLSPIILTHRKDHIKDRHQALTRSRLHSTVDINTQVSSFSNHINL